MALTLSTMRTAVRTRLGDPASDGFFTDAQLTDLINEALQAYATEADWPWLQATETLSTTAGSTTGLTPNAAWTRTKSLIIDGYDALELMALPELREIETTITGLPRFYAVQAEKILVRPIPDAVYSITHDYFKIEPELSGDSDAPLLPNQWRYAIVEFAAYLAHLRQGRGDMAAAALAGYQGWLGRMRDQRRRSSSPMRVRVRPGGGFD